MEHFIRTEDYGVVIGESALRAVTQANEASRHQAELTAYEEIAGYLRPTYDISQAFDGSTERNAYLVTIACDIALYHLSASLPQKMGAEIRKERYDRAIAWLTDVQRGRIIPDLPRTTSDDGSAVGNGGLKWSSQRKQDNTW